MNAQTLDGMTVEQLRDLAARAEASATAKQRELDEAKQRVKDAKDRVPDYDGKTVWEYGGRYWTVVRNCVLGSQDRLVVSVPVKGGVMKWIWFRGRFSHPGRGGEVEQYWLLAPGNDGYTSAVLRLVAAVQRGSC